eukprot:scaffold11425_cov14-Tisochrysis_lutea.AAC.1
MDQEVPFVVGACGHFYEQDEYEMVRMVLRKLCFPEEEPKGGLVTVWKPFCPEEEQTKVVSDTPWRFEQAHDKTKMFSTPVLAPERELQLGMQS